MSRQSIATPDGAQTDDSHPGDAGPLDHEAASRGREEVVDDEADDQTKRPHHHELSHLRIHTFLMCASRFVFVA